MTTATTGILDRLWLTYEWKNCLYLFCRTDNIKQITFFIKLHFWHFTRSAFNPIPCMGNFHSMQEHQIVSCKNSIALSLATVAFIAADEINWSYPMRVHLFTIYFFVFVSLSCAWETRTNGNAHIFKLLSINDMKQIR